MPNVDAYEQEVLSAFEKGNLKSVATKAELDQFRAAARATAVKDRRVTIRLSSIDLNDIQVKALEEGQALGQALGSRLAIQQFPTNALRGLRGAAKKRYSLKGSNEKITCVRDPHPLPGCGLAAGASHRRSFRTLWRCSGRLVAQSKVQIPPSRRSGRLRSRRQRREHIPSNEHQQPEFGPFHSDLG